MTIFALLKLTHKLSYAVLCTYTDFDFCAFFPFLWTESDQCHLLKLFFRELKLQKRLLLTKATWKSIHQSLMEEVVLDENGAVNFRLFFSQQRLDSKKRKWKSLKSQRRWRKSVPFNKLTTNKQEDLSFTKQMLVLYN